jgi:hypothetical protein
MEQAKSPRELSVVDVLKDSLDRGGGVRCRGLSA